MHGRWLEKHAHRKQQSIRRKNRMWDLFQEIGAQRGRREDRGEICIAKVDRHRFWNYLDYCFHNLNDASFTLHIDYLRRLVVAADLDGYVLQLRVGILQ